MEGINTGKDLPLDTRLLSEAIYEFNISRHNVSIYPRDHPIVEKSLNQSYAFLLKLFELRQNITLAIAKDTLIIDDNYLDKKNPVYKDFAQSLSQNNIAYLTFMRGLSKEELYSFHQFLLSDVQNLSSDHIQEILDEYKFVHIKIGLVDYSAFSFTEGELSREEREVSLWERYVYGLMEGRLATGDVSEVVKDIPPDKLAAMINKLDLEKIKGESYERVMTSYVKKSREKTFSGQELRKLSIFIDGLRPELKGQFLSSFVSNVSADIDAAQNAFREMSVDDVITLLTHINEQLVVMPEALKNVLEKFAKIERDVMEATRYGSGLMEDDILLSPEITSLLSEANFKAYVSETYQNEILKLLKYDAERVRRDELKEVEPECSDEYIAGVFHHMVLELLSPERDGIVSPDEYATFITILKEQCLQLIDMGQYKSVLQTLTVLTSNIEKNRVPDDASGLVDCFYSEEFISYLIESFRIMGKERKSEVALICDYYGDAIISPLMNALIDEESPSARRFILNLLTGFGRKILPETLKRLEDDRWFVKRNMLFILMECGTEEALKKARPCCDHENPRVSFEAIKCLLKAGDEHGITALKKCLNAESKDLVNKAVTLSGAYKVEAAVPDLIRLLRKKTLGSNDFEDKIPVVRALGQIGDSRAVEMLRKVLSSRTFLFKGSLEKLKGEIRSALKKCSLDGDTANE